MADFDLVARRALVRGSVDYDLFRWYFLGGADWQLVARRLEIDRGMFWHRVFAVEVKLGRVFAELRPVPLFPIDEYFNGVVAGPRRELPPVVLTRGQRRALQAPLAGVVRDRVDVGELVG